MPREWKCPRCGYHHPNTAKHCSWCTVADQVSKNKGDKKGKNTSANKGQSSSSVKGAGSTASAWAAGPPSLTKQAKGKAADTVAPEVATSPPADSPQASSAASSATSPPESADMIAATELLDVKEAMLASLKSSQSTSAVSQRAELSSQIQDLQHRINALKAPKDRVPGLRKAVKAKERLLEKAIQRQLDAGKALDLAQKECIESQKATGEAKMGLVDLKSKLSDAEKEVAILAMSPQSPSSSYVEQVPMFLTMSAQLDLTPQERLIFDSVMLKFHDSPKKSPQAAVSHGSGSGSCALASAASSPPMFQLGTSHLKATTVPPTDAGSVAGATSTAGSAATSAVGNPVTPQAATTRGISSPGPQLQQAPSDLPIMPTKGDQDNRRLLSQQQQAEAS